MNVQTSSLVVFLIGIISVTSIADEHPPSQGDEESAGHVAQIEFSWFTGVEIADEILASLEAGHRAEIHYEIRLYSKNVGIARLFGDRLVKETSLIYDARWDELNERYVVLIDDEHEVAFESPALCTEFLLSLRGYRIEIPEQYEKEMYLMCRAQIEPIRLVPPLTLMTFLVPKFRTRTPWTHVEYTRIDS